MNDTTTLTENGKWVERVATRWGFVRGERGWLDRHDVRIAITEDEIQFIVFTDEKRRCVRWSLSFDAHNTPVRIIEATLIETVHVCC